MNEIKEIYNIVYNNVEFKNPDKFIIKVEPIRQNLLKLDCESDNYEKGKRLISDYALNKSNQGFDEKALPYLFKAIELQINDFKNSKLNSIKKELIYRTGLILFEKKNYIKSLKYFKKLIDSFPENKEFAEWYNLILKKITKPIDNIFLAGIVICLVIEYVFKIKTDFILYGLIISVTGTLLTIGYYQLKKKNVAQQRI